MVRMKVGLPVRHAAVGVLLGTALGCVGTPQPVAVPLSAIDSLRTVHNERAWMMTAALPFVALGAVVVAWRLSGGD